MFQGFVIQEQTINCVVVTRDANGKPTNADALPTFRVYGPSGYLGVSGTASLLDTGAVTNATDATPVQITAAAHGLSTGAVVTVSGVGGNGGANGTFVVTVVDANNFTLNGSAGTGAYTSGGTWNLAGAYRLTVPCLGANGFAAGQGYDIVTNYAISSALKAELDSFAVV